MSNASKIILFTSYVLLLCSCANVSSEALYPTGYDRTETNGNIYAKRQSIMGDNGFCFGGSDKRAYMSEGAPEILGKAKISLTAAIKVAETKAGGKAYDAEIDRKTNVPRYKIKTLKNKKVSEVLVDANTGSVLAVNFNK